MRNRRPHRYQSARVEFDRLENRLQSTFRPVQPRPEFVGNLRRQLSAQEFLSVVQPGLSPVNFIIILTLTLISTMLIVAMSVRTVAMLVGAFGLWQQIRRQR